LKMRNEINQTLDICKWKLCLLMHIFVEA